VGEEEEAGDRDPEGRGGQAGTRGRGEKEGRRRGEEERGRRRGGGGGGGLVQMDVSLIQEMEDWDRVECAAGRGHSAWSVLHTVHCSYTPVPSCTVMVPPVPAGTAEGDTSTITVHEGTGV